MRRSSGGFRLLSLTIWLACVTAGTAWGAAPASSVQSFMQQKSKWESYAQAKNLLKVEGRYLSISRTLLRFRKCDLTFVADQGKQFPRISGRSLTIEVTGNLEKRRRSVVFVVKRVREMPSDLDTFRQQKSQVRLDNADEWYALGNWATERGAFYDDQELIDLGKNSSMKGITAERRQLPADDQAGLLTLAKKVSDYGLSESVRQQYVHEAFQRRWQSVQTQEPAELRKLAVEITRRFPGSDVPLEPPQPKLRRRYWDAPLTVYAGADGERRRKLHRIFYETVVLESIVKQAEPEGSNGFEIAEEIDRLVPEQHALAEQYRDKELELDFQQVESGTRQEAIELSERFRKRQRPEKANETLRRWVAAKEKRLRQEGPSGLMQVAKEYRSLLEDQETAVKLLIEAYGMSEENKEIADELGRVGYHLVDGEWTTGTRTKAASTDPIQQAMREGRVIVGMTGEQVRKSLGVPNSVARVASVDEVNEVWTYGEPNRSRLVVNIIRGLRRDESSVVSVTQLKGR